MQEGIPRRAREVRLSGRPAGIQYARMSLFDKFGRQITDLRISVTDRCNFRCVYCRSADPENYRGHEEILSWPELQRFAARFILTVNLKARRCYKGNG